MWVISVTLLLLLNGGKLETLQEERRTRQEILQRAGCKARPYFVVKIGAVAQYLVSYAFVA